MEITKEQLVIPVYLNEKIVLDMLAIIEDGFSKVSEVSTSYESADKINAKLDGGFSTKNILEKLLKIQLNAEIGGDSTESDRESSKSEKVHTNVSLFSKFRVALENNDLLFCKAGNEINIEKCNTGDFIEVEGELQKNPMIDLIEKFLEIYKMADIFDDKAPVGTRKAAAAQKASDKKTLKQIEQFLSELKSTGTIDFIVENENTPLVLSAQEKYLSNDNISELLGGRFKVLGKIIKICHDDNEKIDLLRKTTLGILDAESKRDFLSAFNSPELATFNLPKLRTEISGPAFIIIPIAIYA